MSKNQAGRGWLSDFEIGLRGCRVKSTGIFVPYSPIIVEETYQWLRFYFALKVLRTKRKKPKERQLNIFAFPEALRPWYLLWPVLLRSNCQLVKSADQAHIGLFFQDDTDPLQNLNFVNDLDIPIINKDCKDTSKTMVTKINDEIFDVKLSVDQTKTKDRIVEKSEKNGVHDGQIVTGPIIENKPGKVYQKFIDRQTETNGCKRDYRTVIVGGEPTLTFYKDRHEDYLFENRNDAVEWVDSKTCFSKKELRKISEFCTKFGLHWGGIDILREKETNNICVVDVNKTDMGPPTALPLNRQIEAVDFLAEKFDSWINTVI